MTEKKFLEIKSIVKTYSDEFKVDSESCPSAPNSSMFRATKGGWIEAVKHDRYGFIIKKGSLFPEVIFEEVKDLLNEQCDICLMKGSCGTNWTPYHIIESVEVL